MRTALLHYWLTNVRGGEKVFAALCRMFPGADVFTHAYDAEALRGDEVGAAIAAHRVRETVIARLPFGRAHPQAYLPLLPAASRMLNLDAYDQIVSSESGPIKGVRKRAGQRHICYCHTPMRYVWDLFDEYYAAASFPGKCAMRLFAPGLRAADLRSAEGVDVFVANSAFVAARIRRIYGRDAEVVHPPVDVDRFAPTPGETPGAGGYYLYAGADVPYKRLDLAKAACARIGRPLRIVGGGRATAREMREAYLGARALLFPGVEDFGIVPVEAQAAGCPVLAYGKGGALETVEDGVTGLFFHEQTVEGLCHAIEEFESRPFAPAACIANARHFAPARFESRMRPILTPSYEA